MRTPGVSLLVAGLLVTGCSSDAEQEPEPAPSVFSLPADEAEAYPTAYLSAVVPAPEGDDLAEGAGEHVVIANNADIRIDMGGWVIEDADGNRLPLGIGRQIDVGTTLQVHSSCGTSDERAVFACADAEVLGDDGDTLRLLDSAGKPVAELSYGSTQP